VTIKENLQRHNWAIKSYVPLEADLLYSEAFNELSKTSTIVLMRLLQKRRFTGKGKNRKYYNNELIFTYKEAACFGISRYSFSSALKQLVRFGFIEVEHQGGTIGNGRDWSLYRLIDDWKDYGTNKFKPREKAAYIQFSDGLKRHNKRKQALAYLRANSASSVENHTHTVRKTTPERQNEAGGCT
jgi:hypothetical protein